VSHNSGVFVSLWDSRKRRDFKSHSGSSPSILGGAGGGAVLEEDVEFHLRERN